MTPTPLNFTVFIFHTRNRDDNLSAQYSVFDVGSVSCFHDCRDVYVFQ